MSGGLELGAGQGRQTAEGTGESFWGQGIKGWRWLHGPKATDLRM